jgi:uncharacterized glyoxalase superfamily protein PhnB
MSEILGMSALTLATHDMAHAVKFYAALGFNIKYGGPDAAFTSFSFGGQFLNLTAQPAERQWSWWGRMIFTVADVDAFYANAISHGYSPEAPPRNAEWGERYFHITDPDGHELSFSVFLSPEN